MCLEASFLSIFCAPGGLGTGHHHNRGGDHGDDDYDSDYEDDVYDDEMQGEITNFHFAFGLTPKLSTKSFTT
jgi:hypothetical protein